MKIPAINLINNYHFMVRKNTKNKADLSSKNNNALYGNILFGQLYKNTQADEIRKIASNISNKTKSTESVGFFGPDSNEKEELIKNFIQTLKKHDVDVVSIDLNKKSPKDISTELNEIIYNSKVKYNQTSKITAIFVENIDIANDENNLHYSDIVSQLQSLEHSKQKGIIWLWSAKDKESVNSSLLRRTDDFILVKPSQEDSKQTWLEYIALINKMPKTTRQSSLLSEAINTMPKVFPIKPNSGTITGIELLKSIIELPSYPVQSSQILSNYQENLGLSINSLPVSKVLSYQQLKNMSVDSISLADYWLILDGKKPGEYTSRMKEKEIGRILKDENKTREFVSATLDKLQKTNSLIEAARNAYTDILDNEDELTPEQKEILVKHLNSKPFFEVISKDTDSRDEIELELNTLRTLRMLSEEKETIKQNAINNIFNPARNLDLEDEQNQSIVNYIFELLSKDALHSTPEEKAEYKILLSKFEEAKNRGDEEEFNALWKDIVAVAQEFFETNELDNLTDRNIELLNSINKNMKNEKSPKILSLINSPNLTIEQKEFISRYKGDKNFKLMLGNPNLDINEVIEELVYFEAGNLTLINENELDISSNEFNKIMSDRFHEIDKNAKDINIQGNKISSQLDTINSSVLDFSNAFLNYANVSVSLQEQELEQLVKSNEYLNLIKNNTTEIKQYTQALTRAKLAEFQKDKYFKEIVPDIKNILPEGEQVDLEDFLAKVDEIAKKEKSDIRKKKLIKAALIVAGVAITAAGAYYFGPSVVAHLASKLPAQGTISAVGAATTQVGMARSLGNSGIARQVSFGSYSTDPVVLQREIENIKRELDHAIKMAQQGGSDAEYWVKKVDRLTKELAQHQRWLASALNNIKK